MTSGTPESIQNWVLSGFQNCLDLASRSCLEAKAISSSATVTSSGAGQPTCRSAQPNKYRTDRLLSSGSCFVLINSTGTLDHGSRWLLRSPQIRRRCTMAQPQVPEVPRLPVRPPTEDFDVSQRQDVAKLRKHAVGLGGVLFLTVTGSAPISAMLFNVPIMVGFGQGVGAPAAFEFAAIVLVVFAVGYVAMARKKTTAGGFYSYISHGLGRELGIGTGYASVVAYSVFEASLAGGFAYFLSLKFAAYGINIGWPWLALGMGLLMSLRTFFDVRLSSTLLAIGLISEIAILAIFDVFMFSKGHVMWSALDPAKAFTSFHASGKLVA